MLTLFANYVGPPRFTSSIPSSVVVTAGDNFSFPCQAVGPPKTFVYWSRESLKLTNQSAEETLRITNVSKSDEGVYHCHAINKIGRESLTTRLSKKLQLLVQS